ncbi:hypothetical protein PTI98_000260 [Pleurotus ostreatus]|nr:hypothetical protein PTI98_000260 [Pleurotus ostreatus]
MGRPWTTKEQADFLQGRSAEYKEAKHCSRAVERRGQGKGQKRIIQRKAQLRDWYHNHFRVDCRVDSTNAVDKLLKLSEKVATGKRARKATEVFSGCFYQGSATQETVQTRVRDEAPCDEAGELIKEDRRAKSARRMKIYDEEIEAAWKQASDEQKAEVEAVIEEARARRETEEDEEPKTIDQIEGLRRLPALMDAVAKAMQDTCGWSFTILAGGRGPAGNVQTASYHLGKTKNGHTFKNAFKEFDSSIMRPWTSFVRTVCEENEVPCGPFPPTEWTSQGGEAPMHGYHPPSTWDPAFDITNNSGNASASPPPQMRAHNATSSSPESPKDANREPATTTNVGGPLASGTREDSPSLQNPDGKPAPTAPLHAPATTTNVPNPTDLQNQPNGLAPQNAGVRGTREDSPLLQNPDGGPAPTAPLHAPATTATTTNVPNPRDLQNQPNGRAPQKPVSARTPNDETCRAAQGSQELWLTGALTRLRQGAGADWLEAVDLWEQIESEPTSSKAKRFPTDNRPAQVAQWFAYGRSYKDDPDIPDVIKYEQDLLAWWNGLQPEWPRSAGPLPLPSYSAPDGHDWSSLKITGRSGLLVVMVSFAWWGKAVGISPSWLTASADLKHALDAMLSEGKEGTSQR